MKTPQEWASILFDCNRAQLPRRVEMIRVEFTKAIVAELYKEVCDECYGEREKICFGIAAGIVEALAKEVK